MIHVLKANGRSEPFNENKLTASIERAGIKGDLQKEVLAYVESKLYDDIPTSKIYGTLKEFLRKSPQPYAFTKYSLKQSVMSLGPTGYPFEDYIAKILESQGYQTLVRNIVKGICVSHEIDVIATKEEEKIMIEAKFHNLSGAKTGIHVGLYTKARFDDVRENNHFSKAYLITNTKVTTEVILYAECVGIKIMSWNYPNGSSFRETVEKCGLIPVTALTNLSQNQKIQLLDSGIVLAKDLLDKPENLIRLGIPEYRKEDILSEAKYLL